MFWIALEQNNPKMGLIIKLSLKFPKQTAFKSNGVTKFGNTVGRRLVDILSKKQSVPVIHNCLYH